MMIKKRCLFITFMIHLTSIVVNDATTSVVKRQITQRFHKDNSTPEDEKYISCRCSNGTSTILEINETTMNDILSGNSKCSISENLCKLMECKNCFVLSLSCQVPKSKEDSNCIIVAHTLNEDFLENNDLSNSSLNLHRSKRDLKTCVYPTHLKTADVNCTISNKNVKCVQECVIGHTLSEGTKVTLECRKSENKWKPSNFKECDPYVDCTVWLSSGGTADCYTATTKSPAMCYIQCYKYEDHAAVPRRAYTCRTNGSWSKRLPFCAKAGSGIKTVPKPKGH